MDQEERLRSALAASYRIEREIGSGGMATVYLAEDLKHHRQVAVKVLRPDLAAALGSERFHREIQIAAQLQHPNILPLYDSGEADGFLFYVMPYVEGQSLRNKLEREGELPVQEAVRILRDITDALTEAHAKGVVHRDIKPANILLRGRHALVADFGVAKAVSEATGREKFTTAGVALGTPAYMAPEQASADPHLDHRVDIYALGAVAYELLTGRPVFMGNTPQMVLAAHMTEVPQPVRQRRETVPLALEQMVMRCLEKIPADRWQTAEEILPVLEALNTPSGGLTPTSAAHVPVPRPGLSRFVWPLLFVLAVGSGAALLLAQRDQGLGVIFGRSIQVTAEDGLEIHPAISPDGNLVVYAAGTANRTRIFIRPASGGRAISLLEDPTGIQTFPRWSPDGTQILFLSEGGVHVVSALGGASRRLVSPGLGGNVASADWSPEGLGGNVASADWSPDGREVAFLRGDSLQVLDIETGNTRFLSASPSGHSCRWSPQGGLIACVVGNSVFSALGPNFGNLAPSRIRLVPIMGNEPVEIPDLGSVNQSPAWSPDGATLFFVSNREGVRDIYAVKVAEDGVVEGEPQRLTIGLNVQSIGISRAGGKLVYSVYQARANIWTLPIPLEGPVNASGATQVTFGNQIVEFMAVSRDGEWILFDSNLSGNSDLYRLPLSGGDPEQLAHTPVDEFGPDLSPDGREVAFHTFDTGSRDIAVLPLGGSTSELLTSTDGQESYPVWSPDGSSIAFYDQGSRDRPVYLIERRADGSWAPARHLADSFGRPDWSPDGRHLTASIPGGGLSILEIDRGEVRNLYAPRPGTADPQVFLPHWSRDGQVLYFRSYDAEGNSEFWAMPASGGSPRVLVRFDDPLRPSTRPDFAVDDTHFFFAIQDRDSDIWVMELISG